MACMCIYDLFYTKYIIDTLRLCYYIMLWYVMLCYAMLCFFYVMLCYITLYYTILYYIALYTFGEVHLSDISQIQDIPFRVALTTFGTLMNINIAGRWMPHAPKNLIDRYIDPYV